MPYRDLGPWRRDMQKLAAARRSRQSGEILITAAQLRAWAGLGRDLTPAETADLARCIPHSSIPGAIGTIATEALGLRGNEEDEVATRA
jgi:hypothetical protein